MSIRETSSPIEVPFKVVRTRRTFEEIASQLRELMLDGALRPGDRLPPERELCLQMGIGRPALREALRALEVSGLVETKKGKRGGIFIAAGKPSVVSENISDLIRLQNISIEELFEARLWIQRELVRAVCRRATKRDIEALEANIREAEQSNADGDAAQRILTNIEFHNLLAAATRNPVMMVVVRGLTDAMRVLIKRVGSSIPSRATFAVRRRLVDAIKARDETAAVKAMEKILKEAEQMYLGLASIAPGSAIATRTGQIRRGTA